MGQEKGLRGIEKTVWRKQGRKGAAGNTEKRLKLNAVPGHGISLKTIITNLFFSFCNVVECEESQQTTKTNVAIIC